MTSSSVQTIVSALNEAVFVAVEDLIRLKRSAGRPQDLVHAEALEQLRRERDHG